MERLLLFACNCLTFLDSLGVDVSLARSPSETEIIAHQAQPDGNSVWLGGHQCEPVYTLIKFTFLSRSLLFRFLQGVLQASACTALWFN